MLYRIAVVIALAAMFFGCGKNLTGPTEVVKSEAQMEGSNLEVSLPLPEWLKTKLSALPAGKLASGDTGPVAIYVVVSRTAAGEVKTQSFSLVPDLTAGVARGSANIDVGQVTVQAFYSENGQVLFQSRQIPFTIAPNRKYQVNFQMERVDAANVSFAATWDTTKVEEVIIADTSSKTPATSAITPPSSPITTPAQVVIDDTRPIPAPVLPVGTITVVKNAAFSDRSSAMPTGVAGAANGKIASFIIIAPIGEAVDVPNIPLKDPNATNQLGDNFQNLKIMHGGTQIGETIGVMDASGIPATYSFTQFLSIRIPAGAQYVVDVYADIRSSPQDIGVLLSPVVVVGAITATGVSSGNVISSVDVPLQNGYISASGSLTISTSADTPPSRLLMMGENDKDVFTFTLLPGQAEKDFVDEIFVAAVTKSFAPDGTLLNAKLYQGSTQLGASSVWVKWTPPTMLVTNNYLVAGFWNLSLLIPHNGVTLTLKVSASTNFGGASSGFRAIFYLLPDYDGLASGDQPSIVARGASSAMLLTGDALRFSPDKYSVYSAPITVYATKISVAWASDTPRGEAVPAAGQIVAKVVISNAANVGNYSATIRALNFAISTSRKKFATKPVFLKIFKDSVADFNLVGIASWPAGAAIGGNTSIMNTRDTVNDSTFGYNDVEIAPGGSKLFVVTMDTDSLGLVPGDILAITIPPGGVVWRDGVGSNDIKAAEGMVALSTKAFTY